MKKIAYSYIRFSTKGQIDGDSERRQLTSAREYARKHDLLLDDRSYRDLGVSAFRGKNKEKGALGAFLKAIDDGVIDSDCMLLVESVDRLSREEVQEAYDLFSSLTKRGVTIVTLHDEQVYSRASLKKNWTGLVVLMAHMARAHSESDIKMDRLKKQIRNQMDSGKKRGKAPFWLTTNPDKMGHTINEKAEVVREIFRRRLEGVGSLHIAHWLTAEHGWKLTAPQVVRLLKNPSVIGTLISVAGRAPDPTYYPLVVEKQTFFEVQALMDAPIGTKRGRKAEDVPNLFTGLVRCALCGATMRHFREGKTVRQAYLACEEAIHKRCDSGYVNYGAFEKEAIGWLLLDQDDEVVPLIEKQATGSVVAKSEIKALKDQEARLLDLVQSGMMNIQPAKERLDVLKMRIDDLTAAAADPAASRGERPFAERAWELVERHENAKLGNDKPSLWQVRREIKSAFQRAIASIKIFPETRVEDVHHGKFEIAFRGYDGTPQREYTRPALTRIKGVYNGRNQQQAL